MLFQTLHSITTFKFACGLVISFIVFFNFIDNIKNKDNRIILSTITLLLGISCFGNVKSDGNLIYVYDYKKEDYYFIRGKFNGVNKDGNKVKKYQGKQILRKAFLK